MLLSGKMTDVIQGEEALQIDIVTENEDKQTHIDDEMTGATNECEATLSQSPMDSEVDSGCWIRDVMTTERGSITCSEDYCTLSDSLRTYSVWYYTQTLALKTKKHSSNKDFTL